MPALKKSRPSKSSKPSKSTSTTFSAPTTLLDPALPPSRVHTRSYHYARLLDEREASDALLKWFEGVEETRSMPWRKKWVDPQEWEGKEEELEGVLAKRAYEVWVSEIMCQQTRVSTVIPYFNTWIAKWPTIRDLAEADHDDVLNVWKGLGYYSRATRLHEGAKAMIAKRPDSSCPIPNNATDLQQFPGIGRYTAGAISSIAFGVAEPVLDGNVMRVLSRQMGLYVDVKDKKSMDVLWDTADQLIKHVSASSGQEMNSIPGQWNQALMELGATICTPQPRCTDCPIRTTCRAYKEGEALSKKNQAPTAIPDIEDACTLCDILDTEDLVTAPDDDEDTEEPRPPKKRRAATKQSNTLSNYFAIGTPKSNAATDDEEASEQPGKRKRPAPTAKAKAVANYCALFPKKVAKKKAAEEECAVCMVELCFGDGGRRWLIEQRPAKGLLASLWQFPQTPLTTTHTTASGQKSAAQAYITSLAVGDVDMSTTRCVAVFTPLVHVFSHLRLTMHAYRFQIDVAEGGELDFEGDSAGLPKRRWVSTEEMEEATLSTGMRRCWELVGKEG